MPLIWLFQKTGLAKQTLWSLDCLQTYHTVIFVSLCVICNCKGSHVTDVGCFEQKARGDSLSFPFVKLSALSHPWVVPCGRRARQMDITDRQTDRDALPSAVNSDSHEPDVMNLGLLVLWCSPSLYSDFLSLSVWHPAGPAHNTRVSLVRSRADTMPSERFQIDSTSLCRILCVFQIRRRPYGIHIISILIWSLSDPSLLNTFIVPPHHTFSLPLASSPDHPVGACASSSGSSNNSC